MTDAATSVEDMSSSSGETTNAEVVEPISSFAGEERLRFQLPPYEIDSNVVAILSLYNKQKNRDGVQVQLEKLIRTASMLFVLHCKRLSFDFFYQVFTMLNDLETQYYITRIWLASSAVNCIRSAQTRSQYDFALTVLLQLWQWLQNQTLFSKTSQTNESFYARGVESLLSPSETVEESAYWTANAMLVHFGCSTGVQPHEEDILVTTTPKNVFVHCFQCTNLRNNLIEALGEIKSFAKSHQYLVDMALREARHHLDGGGQFLCLIILKQIDRGRRRSPLNPRCCCGYDSVCPIFCDGTFAVPAIFAVAWRRLLLEVRDVEYFLTVVESLQRVCFTPNQDAYESLICSYMSQWSARSFSLTDYELHYELCLWITKPVAGFSGPLSDEEVESINLSFPKPQPASFSLLKSTPTTAPRTRLH